MENALLSPRMYARITGIALAAVALLGIVMELAADGSFIPGFLEFDWTHDIVHVVLAAVALFVGFGASPAFARTYAKLFGVVYLALGVVGFFVADLVILQLELGENLVHLLIGAWGVAAGFFSGAGVGTGAAPMAARR